ncbi:cell division protein FtsZ [Roseobacter sp. SK209-2-6]|nr:cell division protein FtsZ [Roseobacter sp. SK209-2-6]
MLLPPVLQPSRKGYFSIFRFNPTLKAESRHPKKRKTPQNMAHSSAENRRVSPQQADIAD